MRETPVDLGSSGQALSGTWCAPHGAGPHAAALLLTGSGPLDRDGNHRRMRLDVSRQLAHALAAAGVATLRYDKRGVGRSPGDWRAAGLYDNVADAEAALDHLATRGDVDAERIVVVGHSEGAVLAAALAARRSDLAGIVLLAGAARTGEQVLLWQAEQIIPTLPLPVRAFLGLLRANPVAKVATNHARIKATTADVVRLGGMRTNARWFREYLAHDPAGDLAQATVPVLAITGDKDLQVPSADLAAIEAAARGPATTRLVPDLTHTLRRQGGPPSLRRYREEVKRPVDPEVLELVTEWVTWHGRHGEPSPGAAC